MKTRDSERREGGGEERESGSGGGAPWLLWVHHVPLSLPVLLLRPTRKIKTKPLLLSDLGSRATRVETRGGGGGEAGDTIIAPHSMDMEERPR
eukprot:scaffold206691_cov26-Tisochrysis_lutea.AAC.1